MDTLDDQIDKIVLKPALWKYDDYKEVKSKIKNLITEACQNELAQTCLAGMPELTPRQQDYITDRIKILKEGKDD